MTLQAGHEITLCCLGHLEGARWLAVQPTEGNVILAQQAQLAARSRIRDGGEGMILLECLGLLKGHRWLDGRTVEGTVGLAPQAGEPYSGTRWRVHDGGEGAVLLECLGNLPGYRWLDGRTANATVGLAPHSAKPFTGTRWSVTSAASVEQPDLPARETQGSTRPRRRRPRRSGHSTSGGDWEPSEST